MKALVIGFGSIGARHARLLVELGAHVAVVSRRDVDFPVVYRDLAEALETECPDYVVVANETSQHRVTLLGLAESGYAGVVLVEKPIFDCYYPAPSPSPFIKVFVAYNLRFHPAIRRLKGILEHESALSILAYVGQYLPEWRPGTDYRLSYSASPDQGGGVLRDLSHELDYLVWMLGGWESVAAIGGHFSPLEIHSDDIYSITMRTSACPIVNLQMNYLDRVGRRFLLVNTVNHTIEVDFAKGLIAIDGEREAFVAARDSTYRAMHEAILSGDEQDLCTMENGVEIMRLIEAIESSAKNEAWVRR